MNVSICTISFRHALVSIDQLADWAKAHDVDGIELWAPHARHLFATPSYNGDWLKKQGLIVPMVSDYFPLYEEWNTLIEAAKQASRLLTRWNTNHIRTFAGAKGSKDTTKAERAYLVKRLACLCDYFFDKGHYVLVETHPHTLCDTVPSTLQLLAEVDHPGLAINFDVLHVWESGADVNGAFKQLQPHIRHLHVKNIRSPEDLDVFAPENVYAAAGSREGMAGLFNGCVDYESFLSANQLDGVNVSIEWFGNEPFHVLEQDCQQLMKWKTVPNRVVH
ncbi:MULTISPECIES: sugar phosphate isomerase/epimerase family protein [Shouchella]|uniref:Xylose isomerase-like TIM barrel domain-containing protein n=2 Tax=Shouchella TaxID=2893057 RepID=Q5WGL8_SHOC1|nr:MULTISPECIES: sugar phosphate isomerase/epimerase [Shouchella]MCM3379415.1 sugar phosphate isomerase/epimerase [Shouchella rhizosphaerae]MDO7283206.1 sugar phosphate isomerase/epimerase [Shouchella clausii]MDO7303303.1 sugar phosphate isomerase/epimerase [Shouchella clausii]PAE95546.1 sugar phosphate isomerase/epimerase [Shouchella clausii]SHL06458.1 3-dehydroshikimate dehydratase [Shouchella rhizosphaerae]